MQAASVFFLIGVVLNAAARNIAMLIIGRILLGVGVGFANQVHKYRSRLSPLYTSFLKAVPLFLSEIAPVHISMVIAETPTSLIEREQLMEGLAMLKKIRGTDNVNAEYEEILHACEMARQVKRPFRNLMKRSSRPQLVIAIAMQVFQQFTGINAIMFYAPVLFQTIGFKNDASLLSAVITGIVNVLSTVVSVVLVDKLGRRFLLLEACGQMLITQVVIGGVLLVNLKSTNELEHGVAVWVVVLVCLFVSSFAWSWGPLGWLIPSETFPLATRTAGENKTVIITKIHHHYFVPF
ncbi:Sugar transport protein [Musa troglodytarum]|uniref:Sugar transport protein n=1 Tax=Musa troglodytarum TaxID=320322 RepID=A0A9E7JFY6_9LILI|nr:Sugar transport protein [Musa troglodytarum]